MEMRVAGRAGFADQSEIIESAGRQPFSGFGYKDRVFRWRSGSFPERFSVGDPIRQFNRVVSHFCRLSGHLRWTEQVPLHDRQHPLPTHLKVEFNLSNEEIYAFCE